MAIVTHHTNFAGLSAVMSGFPFLRPDRSDPLDQVPTTFLAMLETADGCVKFIEQRAVAHEIVTEIVRPITARLESKTEDLRIAAIRRRYELVDRSGPGGMVLHYRERVD